MQIKIISKNKTNKHIFYFLSPTMIDLSSTYFYKKKIRVHVVLILKID